MLNYNLLFGHATDMIAYINYAASKGLKVIVTLHHPRIWRDNTYAANYPVMYADSGNAATGTLFMQYVVNQAKGLAGTWGYYVGDETVNADHTTWLPYATAIRTADSTHPRLFIGDGQSANSVATGNSLYFDGCEVMGDDYYPIGPLPTTYAYPINTHATNVQAFDTGKSLQSAMTLQAFSFANYPANGWPPGTPWPTYAQMSNLLSGVVNHMMPRLILWYSYFDIVTSGNPTGHWNDLVALIANMQNRKFGRF